jgi:hypothetical protein
VRPNRLEHAFVVHGPSDRSALDRTRTGNQPKVRYLLVDESAAEGVHRISAEVGHVFRVDDGVLEGVAIDDERGLVRGHCCGVGGGV